MSGTYEKLPPRTAERKKEIQEKRQVSQLKRRLRKTRQGDRNQRRHLSDRMKPRRNNQFNKVDDLKRRLDRLDRLERLQRLALLDDMVQKERAFDQQRRIRNERRFREDPLIEDLLALRRYRQRAFERRRLPSSIAHSSRRLLSRRLLDLY
ncbi:hypothetical protein EHI8A_065930 [Entamoeba histolytica HM-1:IMSS-B]|uniref:Uncharacterized protein n=6 Tax=Entamoeba histolytica TaxID=5759 RepID=B1N405_ENTH1|nr:hypothetical protein EHI_088060 [Entamoeba histolytica HM-1:IMSS]EMD44171.1 Hypothetical protein EHI5A_081040 [Entamoeba histolytica KU27]EMH75389.1 hypothetical protein EHI8A_065930 [Entamoeba histolytica HM-1:IMSS-B]EMS15961.1 hypothetical protein KM1_177480 [Entamoeba histolytica HM-3:IMSS]ENY63964.1 hypothetical protein EHI7A_062770 [Entamoeba histolytica HM-1:IMSS-A]GAT97187.1 hypothetical protein CL6EHI_088060 [Entamoeba histolytica]|eukprot:XP_001913921.1 hypothetical protein EHI_088060 [Entamoeba histolytica HM-1:IMSS]